MDSQVDIIEKNENETPIFNPIKKVKKNEKIILNVEDDSIMYLN